MKNKIKIIDLLCLVSNGEEVPKEIYYKKQWWKYNPNNDYEGTDWGGCLLNNVLINELNDEVEILDEEDDNDIPLIPDDELYSVFDSKEGINKNKRIDYNFKVLQEKINQVVKEFNEYRKENE